MRPTETVEPAPGDATARGIPLSTRARVFLVAGLTLLLSGLATTAIAYLDIRSARLAAAEHRLSAAAEAVATTWEVGFARVLEQMTVLAQRPELADAVSLRGVPSAEAADRLDVGGSAAGLLERSARAAQNPAVIELWDATGSRVFATSNAPAALDGETTSHLIGKLERKPAAVALSAFGGELSLDVVAAIGEAADPIGYLVRRQSVAGSRGSAQSRFRGLVGLQATVYLGDPARDLWTDLTGAVEPPSVTAIDGVESVVRDGAPMLVSGREVPGSPLVALVEVPVRPLLADARSAASRLALIALAATALALAVLWLLITRLTRPLVGLADAAAGIAGGAYDRRVDVGPRRDEIGRLALAFNHMAERVEASHHRLEERVAQRTAELTATTEELEAFAYSVSHDLRAPLRAIDGFSQALLEDYALRLDDPGRDYLRRVRRATQRMASLIDQLLRLSRVTRAPLERRRVNLSEIAQEVVDDLRVAEPERLVEVSIAPDLWLEGDPALMRSLLENLLGNAWKFTSLREDARIELSANGDGREPVISVRDNGAGFDMTYAEKLFTPFQRLHDTSEFEGSGVGLATVRRIVRRHGGRVWAEGIVGSGATVHFSLGGAAAGGGGEAGG